MSDTNGPNFKPDMSDRPYNSYRATQKSTIPDFKVTRPNRRHILLLVGLILILLISLMIMNIMKNSTELTATTTQNNSILVPKPEAIKGTEITTITVPAISDIPTEAAPRHSEKNQQRVEIPGEITDKLINSAPSIVVSTPAIKPPPAPTASSVASFSPGEIAALKQLPGQHFVLQLSAASRKDSLETLARRNQLRNYWIYETRRNEKPWFTLIQGSYADRNQAQKAIQALPETIKTNKPWIKPVRHVHREIK